MIVVRAPLRISFVGGGSDLPAYLRHGEPGYVVSTTIAQSVYVTLSASHDGKTRLHYKEIEVVDDPTDLRHDRARECLRLTRRSGVEIHSIADMPAGSGLGSSSAFTVALLTALGSGDPARHACAVEIDRCGHPIGYQDAYASAWGGLRAYTFRRDGLVASETIPPPPGLAARLFLLPVGGTHDASQILRGQAETDNRADTRRLVELAREFAALLRAGDLDGCGAVLKDAWKVKRRLAPGITTPYIDALSDHAYGCGAQGVKLLGAGGAGYLLCWMPEGVPMPGAMPVCLWPNGAEVVYRG